MKTGALSEDWQVQINQIQEEVKELESQLNKPHQSKPGKHDYDIKSKIIDKQNIIIEILIKEAKRNRVVPKISEQDRNKVAF